MSKKALSTVVTIGIDVSRDCSDVCFLDEDENIVHQGQYSVDKYKALVKKIAKLKPRIAILEATGGYERTLAALFITAGVAHRIVNPLRTRQFANSIGALGKTDAIDARILALYALRNKIEPSPVPDENTVHIKALCERRRQLMILRTAEMNRLHRNQCKAAIKSIKAVLAILNAQIADIDGKLDEAVDGDEDIQAKAQILISVPGVGKQTVRTLLGDMPELGTINRKQAAALAGLAPYPRDSGKQRGKRMISGGRHWVRSSIYMATLSAVQHNQPLKRMYHTLLSKGKEKKVALTACMRKLLLLLNSLLKKMEYYA